LHHPAFSSCGVGCVSSVTTVFVVVDGVFLVGECMAVVHGGGCCGWVLPPESRVGGSLSQLCKVSIN